MELEETEETAPPEQTNAERTAALRKLGTISLQGKDYLQVAHRILLFRLQHPGAGIRTGFETIGETAVAVCQVVDASGKLLAIAHKSVQSGGRGPAAKYPLEMAETGAIGRALGLCGYGTLSGDIDEGDQIADAPQTAGKW